jgi:hypothetical protein
MECSTHLTHFTRLSFCTESETDFICTCRSIKIFVIASQTQLRNDPSIQHHSECSQCQMIVRDSSGWCRMVQDGAGGAYCALNGSSLKSEQSYGRLLVFISELLKIECYLCSVLTLNFDLNID